ncbi:MAG: HAMP domain-containing histidine kinase [Oscillospiraceae bacterium]|nr:HAMP domain-containing histidine kinase [Oscillospiraceae bacterium]
MKHRRNQEKKKFGRYYLKRFGIVVLLLSLYGGYYTYFRIYKEHLHRELEPTHFSKDDIQEQLDLAEKDGMLETRLARITTNYYLDGTDGTETGAVLFKPGTEEYYFATPCLIAIVSDNNGDKSERYELTDPDMLRKINSMTPSRDIYPLIANIYPDNNSGENGHYPKFYPGEVFAEKQGLLNFALRVANGTRFAYWFDNAHRKGEWVDLAPENTAGLQKVENDKSKEQLTIIWSDSFDENKKNDGLRLKFVMPVGTLDAPHLEPVKQNFADLYTDLLNNENDEYRLMKQKYDENALTQEDLEQIGADDAAQYLKYLEANHTQRLKSLPRTILMMAFMSDCDFEKTRYAYDIYDVTYCGEQWALCCYRYEDTWETFKLYYSVSITLMLILLLPAAAVIALIWSVISYLIYSRRYDLDAYRRSLTGALAHDLKTPLAVISGNAENLRAHNHPEKADEYADCIIENVQHMDEMIAGVLGLAELEGSAAPERKETVDLTALLHTAFQRNDEQAKKRSLTIKESGKFEIKGNSEMLKQLAENLAANAVQHTAEGGTITVTAEGTSLRISNPFDGELDEKELCKPFKRGDAARGNQSGSGLGLSIVQQIAVLHKIRLHVAAREGVFTVELKKR